MPAPFVLTTTSAPAPLRIVGEELTILASGAATGSYEIFRQAGPEGSGPPPHNHPWDEAFYVLGGIVEFGIDDQSEVASAGTLVHLPAGTTHWFRFGAGGGEMLSVTSREGASHMFTDIAREVDADHPDLAKLVEVTAPHGLVVAVPAT